MERGSEGRWEVRGRGGERESRMEGGRKERYIRGRVCEGGKEVERD